MNSAPDRRPAKGKVLVLGKDSRSFLATIRSLGRAGLEVHVAWHAPDSLALKSRYVAGVHELPRCSGNPADWREELATLLRRERFDLVLPTNDPTIYALRTCQAELERLARLHLPGEKTFEIAFDKLRTWELARSLAIPVPRQRRVTEPVAPGELAAELGWPVVLKPRASFAFDREKRVHQVRKAYQPRELSAYLATLLELGEVLAQENLAGEGVGVEVLAFEGEVLLAFQHRRLHEPPQGGSSSYRRGEKLDPSLLKAARDLARGLELTGVAMMEFKHDPAAGRFALIEINARFWGSLPLAVASGVNFPLALYELIASGRREFETRHVAGLACRNLHMDFGWFLQNRRVDASVPTLAHRTGRQLLGELANLLRLRERSDALVLDDPWPGVVELLRTAREAGSILAGKLGQLGVAVSPLRRARARSLCIELARARSVLFVCKGNLCRSPFAERVARAHLSPLVRVASAGTWPETGRPCPCEAVEAARGMGVDLSLHRSKLVDAEALSAAELVIVFDRENLRTLAGRFPSVARKIHLLGEWSERGDLSIRDPYGGTFSDYESAYRAIASALTPAPAYREAVSDAEPSTVRLSP